MKKKKGKKVGALGKIQVHHDEAHVPDTHADASHNKMNRQMGMPQGLSPAGGQDGADCRGEMGNNEECC